MRKLIASLIDFARMFPEAFALPVTWVFLVLSKSLLEYDLRGNAIIPYDWIQFPIMAALILMFANAIVHGAIRFNQPEIWKQYKSWIQGKQAEPVSYTKYLIIYLAAFCVILYCLL